MRILKWVLLILLAVVLLVLAGFTVWAYTPLGPMPEALAALRIGCRTCRWRLRRG